MIEILENSSSIEKDSQLNVFLMFKTNENMYSFLNKKANLKKFEIEHQYTTIPVLYGKSESHHLKDIETNGLIHKIDIDYRCYLSSNSTGEPIQNNREISFIFQEKKNKGQGIRIALVDSGIDHNLKTLKNSVVSKVDITNELWDDLAGHGTLMAGVIADIVPKSELVDVKIASRSGLVYASHVLKGLDQLFSIRIDILMLGVSSPVPTDGSDVLTTMLEKYVEKGVLVVVPAGNFGPEANTIGFPAQISKSFCIGSLNPNEEISFFSSRTTEKPDFYVMGENIISTNSFHGSLGRLHPTNSEKRIISGTSVAAAKFTSLLAMKKQQCPDYEYKDFYDSFRQLSSESGFLPKRKINETFGLSKTKLSPFKKAMLISSLVTLTLALFGIVSVILSR